MSSTVRPRRRLLDVRTLLRFERATAAGYVAAGVASIVLGVVIGRLA